MRRRCRVKSTGCRNAITASDGRHPRLPGPVEAEGESVGSSGACCREERPGSRRAQQQVESQLAHLGRIGPSGVRRRGCSHGGGRIVSRIQCDALGNEAASPLGNPRLSSHHSISFPSSWVPSLGAQRTCRGQRSSGPRRLLADGGTTAYGCEHGGAVCVGPAAGSLPSPAGPRHHDVVYHCRVPVLPGWSRQMGATAWQSGLQLPIPPRWISTHSFA